MTSLLECTVATLRFRRFKSIVSYVFMGEGLGCVVKSVVWGRCGQCVFWVFYMNKFRNLLFGCFVREMIKMLFGCSVWEERWEICSTSEFCFFSVFLI
jgi:hypothetical protein